MDKKPCCHDPRCPTSGPPYKEGGPPMYWPTKVLTVEEAKVLYPQAAKKSRKKPTK